MADLAEGLRRALASELDSIPAGALAGSVDHLMSVYRSGPQGDRPFLGSDVDVAAYAAYRMPATYGAVRAALAEVAGLVPEFRPVSQLDIGGGTGAAVWAAVDVFPALDRVTVLDQVAAVLSLGRRLARAATHPAVRAAQWQRWVWSSSVGSDSGGRTAEAPLPSADLVTISYLLGELAPEAAGDLVARACASAGLVVVVEPGTPAGYRRVIEARAVLIERGFRIVAPCPHSGGCPIPAGQDWCHFATRISRSALHRRLKAGQLAYEDEKFSYIVGSAVVGSAFPTGTVSGRVVRHPVFRKGLVSLSICSADGGIAQELVSKRQGPQYRSARDTRWGSSWPPQLMETPDMLSANSEMGDTLVDPG